MAELTMEKLREAARILKRNNQVIGVEIGSYDWAEWLLKAAGMEVPRHWPRSTPFYTINYKTLVYDHLERYVNGN